MAIRAHRHRLTQYHVGRVITYNGTPPSRVLAPSRPIPTAQDAEDIVSKSWKRCGAHHSKSCLHQLSPTSTHRLHDLVETTFGPDPFRIALVPQILGSCDSQWQARTHEQNWTFHRRLRCCSSTDNYTRGNKRQCKLKSSETCVERQQEQNSWAACRFWGPGLPSLSPKEEGKRKHCLPRFVSTARFPSEPDLPTLAGISSASRKPAAGSRKTTVGSCYRCVPASTNPVITLNLADASDSFPTWSQSMAKIREECSVAVMDGEEEDRVSAHFR